jgi:hypothetical protein
MASSNKLFDTAERVGCFFVFPDISIKSKGKYRMVFSVLNINPFGNDDENDNHTHVSTKITSEIFQIYASHDYPGRSPPSKLYQLFVCQGVSLPASKLVDKRRMAELNARKPDSRLP